MMRFFDEGTAVDDADVDGFVVGEIDDAHPGSEGQRAVRGGELFHVVDLAVGGGAAVIRMAVPAGESGFAVWISRCVRGSRRGGGVMLLRATGERQTRQHQRGDRGRISDRSARGHLVRS